MITLAEAIKDAELDRQSQLKQIIQMNAQLSMLNEQMQMTSAPEYAGAVKCPY